MKFLKRFSNISDKSATLASFISTVYLIILFLVYPLFMKNGYVNISYDKYNFFLYSSLGAVLLLLLTGGMSLIKSFSKFSATDIFVLLFILISVLSFFFSDYRQDSFLGSEGWYMGLLTIIVLCSLYFLISRLWEFEKIVIYVLLLGSFTVFLLGILDRFSLYIIPLEIRNPAFISTIGNINWFMGFYSILTPVGVILLLTNLKKNHENGIVTIQTRLLFVYVFVAFLAGFAQGSDSIILFDAALFLSILGLSKTGRIHLEHSLLLIMLWGISQLIFVIMMKLPFLKFNYEISGVFTVLTNIYLPIIILGICFGIYFLVRSAKSLDKDIQRIKRKTVNSIFGIFAGVILLWFTLGIINTNTGFLSTESDSVFVFNQNFASRRGETLWAGSKAFGESDLREKLIGAGPDMFDEKVYSIEEISNDLKLMWPNDRLTNAHSEPLTMLVNEGIFGLLAYGGIFLSFIFCGFKKLNSKETEIPDFVIAVSVAVICYLCHNLLSFSQILSTPFIFVLMAMAKARKL